MSIKLMSLVLETTFQPTPKIVALVLADRADDNGGSLWPSNEEVARKASLSVRQVQRLLHWFDEIGLVRVVANESGGKPGETCRRRINVAALKEYAEGKPAPRFAQKKTGDAKSPLDDETGDFGDAGRVTFAPETGDSEVTQSTMYPSGDTPPPKKPPEGGADGFDSFWKAYPKKVGKDAARRAFDKRKPGGELLAEMLHAIAVQRESVEWKNEGGKFIPNPSTWLNQGRWQDELTPAHAAPAPAPTDRKSRQLVVASLLTGAARATNQPPHQEAIDVESRVISART